MIANFKARFKTLCVHAGQHPDPTTGAIVTPIYQTSTYVQEALGQHKGYEYSRTQNPTREAAEANIAALEGGRAGIAFASGMAAIDAISTFLISGDHMVVTENTYGGTYRLFEQVRRRYQLDFSYVDTSYPDRIIAALTPKTKMLFIETPANPLLGLTDLVTTVEIARSHDLTVVVDNTFASPCAQRPLDYGVDLVVHSTTKYLNGHADSLGGMVVALALRMAQHSANGLALAKFLSAHPKVERVFYPGLPDHPQHELATRQMQGFGGMLAFDLGSLEAARTVLNGVSLFSLAESLGGVESLISHPAPMPHASVPPDQRLARGITDGLIRISVGIEDAGDLEDDLRQALSS